MWFKDNIDEYRGLLLFLILMSVFRSSIADWNDVPTSSMRPTIIEGDRILINKLAYDVQVPFLYKSLYRYADPERGDIIVFESSAAGKRLVKRVVGIPGDQVAMSGNRVILNGELMQYEPEGLDLGYPVFLEQDSTCTHKPDCSPRQVRLSQLEKSASVAGQTSSTLTVPQGHYLVLGDNRANSADSRYIGFVPRDEIIGRAKRVVISLDREHYFIPRTTRVWDSLDPV
ncbi:MAG: signal peptidase I [Granulosicoccus sp.]|nr:signal peptidase I [Granulosicoccus sp.]